MNKERKALRRLLPGRRGARLFGFVLLFLALELAVMAWFAGEHLAPRPALLDEQTAAGEYVYLTVAEDNGQFARDDREMGYYFFTDREGYLCIARMDMARYVATAERLKAGETVTLEGTAHSTPARLQELVIMSWNFVDQSNYYDYFTACYLDCTETPTFLPALLCAVAALVCLFCAMAGFAVWLGNLRARDLCLDRLEELGLLGDALQQLSAGEGQLEFAPDVLVTRDFLAVGGTGRICALKDVRATEMRGRFRLILGNGRAMPVQHGLFPRLDVRLLEHLCRLFRKE